MLDETHWHRINAKGFTCVLFACISGGYHNLPWTTLAIAPPPLRETVTWRLSPPPILPISGPREGRGDVALSDFVPFCSGLPRMQGLQECRAFLSFLCIGTGYVAIPPTFPQGSRLMGPCVWAFLSFFSSGPFRVGDMERPLSSWGYGSAPFQLGICTGPFPVGDMDWPVFGCQMSNRHLEPCVW